VLHLELTGKEHRERWLAAVARSKNLHHPWVFPASTTWQFNQRLKRYRGGNNVSLLAIDDSDELIACVNLNEIVRGAFQSAYVGYFVFEPFAGKGLMRQAMELVIDHAFHELGLHRVEANIQPSNHRSLKLVKSLGFRHEGFSPRYLKIEDEWKDHERFALTIEDLPGRTMSG
jgi:ribosomal-protein-alanine N-acetyltransferase